MERFSSFLPSFYQAPLLRDSEELVSSGHWQALLSTEHLMTRMGFGMMNMMKTMKMRVGLGLVSLVLGPWMGDVRAQDSSCPDYTTYSSVRLSPSLSFPKLTITVHLSLPNPV